MPLEKIDKTLRKIEKVVGKKIGEAGHRHSSKCW
jgi:hypothetical protein